MNKFIKGLTDFIKMKWFGDLITNNNGKSSKSWFLVVVTLVGIGLLVIPGIILILEAYYNHTIATDLNGLAAYIAAVSTMFVTVGATKVLGERNEKNQNNIKSDDMSNTDEIEN